MYVYSSYSYTKVKQIKAGQHNVTIRHAEVLQHEYVVETPEKGMIYIDNLRSARATDVYIFNHTSEDTVTYEPTFTYHGFRYVEIRGFEPRLSKLMIGYGWRVNAFMYWWSCFYLLIGDIKGYVTHTDIGNIGSINFSSPILNQIQSAIHWGQRANIMSILTDCPQRDERKGWLGDAQLSGEEALFNFDMVATLIKFLRDIVDTQVRPASLYLAWARVPEGWTPYFMHGLFLMIHRTRSAKSQTLLHLLGDTVQLIHLGVLPSLALSTSFISKSSSYWALLFKSVLT